MRHEFFLKIKHLFVVVMLFALGGCASGPSAPSNVIACPSGDTTRYTYTFSDGSRYDGHFYCDSRGHGSPAGKGTLHTTDGKVIKADGWGSTANGLPRLGGEVEIRYPNGQTDRFFAPGNTVFDWSYDLPAQDGSGVLTGRGQLIYTVFLTGNDQWVVKVGGKIALGHLGPRSVQKAKINCGDVPAGYVMTRGNCTNSKPDGKVAFHTPDGLEKLALSYANGQPTGTLRYAKIHINSKLEKSNAFLFPNIVSDATNPYGNTGRWLRDVVELDISGVHIAIGTPKVVRSGATTILEFSTLERYTAHQGYGNDIFFGGGTAKLTPYGDGKCEATRYSYDTHQKRSDLSVPLEACSYKHVGIMLRSDDRAVNRRQSRDDAEKQRQRESDERWAENQRQRAETARQSAEEDRQSTREYNAAIGAQILQGAAENAALLNKIDRQTNAAIRDSKRVLAAQAAKRDRARAEREDREANRRRDAERERAARAEAERSSARARTAESQPELPKYQPQVVTIPSGRQTCPPRVLASAPSQRGVCNYSADGLLRQGFAKRSSKWRSLETNYGKQQLCRQ